MRLIVGNFQPSWAPSRQVFGSRLPAHGRALLIRASKQIQIVSLTLKICSYIVRAFGEVSLGDRVKTWMDWEALFQLLLTQGRIWGEYLYSHLNHQLARYRHKRPPWRLQN